MVSGVVVGGVWRVVLWYIAETQDRVINLEAIRNTFRTEQLVRYAENWVLRPGDKATSR